MPPRKKPRGSSTQRRSSGSRKPPTRRKPAQKRKPAKKRKAPQKRRSSGSRRKSAPPLRKRLTAMRKGARKRVTGLRKRIAEMRKGMSGRQTETTIAAFVAMVAAIVGIGLGRASDEGAKYLTLERLGRFEQPVDVVQPPGGVDDLYVVEKPGVVRKLTDAGADQEPFLDIRDLVKDTGKGGEQGLLSIEFAPDYAESGLFYIAYTDNQDDLRVVEYKRDPNDDQKADPATARNLITIGQPTPKHHGGQLLFGPDGHLYIGSGDGGPSGDPNNVSQNTQLLLGKILRIDPQPGPPLAEPATAKGARGKKGRSAQVPAGPAPYTIPKDNPLVGAPGRDEIFAYGLRNPWRFTFDRATGAMAIGDVGDETFEEVDYLPTQRAKGANFGWNAYEGFAPRRGGVPRASTVLPVLSYAHGRENCAITGGYVVRDPRLSRVKGREIVGRYLYGDYCSGRLFAFRPRPDGRAGKRRSFPFEVPFLSSFGEDSQGRIYLTQQFEIEDGQPAMGAVYRLETSRK